MEWHINFAVDGRRPLGSTDVERLAVVRSVVEAGQSRLILFTVVDEHVHVVLEGTPLEVGHVTSGIVRSLSTSVDLLPAHRRAVDGRAHLERLVTYFGTQSAHHGLPGHPALWPGSCFADLVGARLLEGFDRGGLYRLLPRWRDADVCRALGVPALTPAPEVAVRRMGAFRLALEAQAAFACDDLSAYRRPDCQRARAALVAVARRAGIAATEVAVALETTVRGIRRLGEGITPALQAVLERRIALVLAVESLDASSFRTRPAERHAY